MVDVSLFLKFHASKSENSKEKQDSVNKEVSVMVTLEVIGDVMGQEMGAHGMTVVLFFVKK